VSIKVTATTMGVSTPASVAEGTRWYRYRGGQPGNEPSPAEPQPQNAKATAMRAERLRRYFAARDAGKSEAEAAVEAGGRETAGRAYEAEYQEQRQEDCDV